MRWPNPIVCPCGCGREGELTPAAYAYLLRFAFNVHPGPPLEPGVADRVIGLIGRGVIDPRLVPKTVRECVEASSNPGIQESPAAIFAHWVASVENIAGAVDRAVFKVELAATSIQVVTTFTPRTAARPSEN